MIEPTDQKMETIKHSPRLTARVVLFGFLATLLTALLLGISTGVEAVSRGYKSNGTLRAGDVVALAEGEADTVELASPSNLSRVVGIVVQPADSSVIVASSEAEVFVKVSGEAEAYVSDASGSIAPGDVLTVSPLRGILVKAAPGEPGLATALTEFSGDSGDEVQVTREDGSANNVRVGKIKVGLTAGVSAVSGGGKSQTGIEKFASSIVGKEVTSLQAIVALIIFCVMLVGEGSIIYGVVSSSIVSLGRNPLAEKLIHRELLRTLGVALAVLAVGLGSVYLVLWV